MKRVARILIMVGVILLVYGCSGETDGTNGIKGEEVELKSSFDILSKDKLQYVNIEKLRDKDTGCYYLSSSRVDRASLVQMYVEKDGVSVPYCDEMWELDENSGE